MVTATAERNVFKVEYMQPFLDSLKLFFEDHLKGELTIGKMQINATGRPAYDISGVISFTSSAIIGRAVLSFPSDVAGKITKEFAQIEELDTGMVADCVGEVANIVVGRAKSFMENAGITISPPTVIQGSDFTITPQRGAPTISIPCNCKHGATQLDISIVDAHE